MAAIRQIELDGNDYPDDLDPVQYKRAAVFAAYIKATKKRIEECRKEIKAPLDKAAKKIQTLARQLTEPLDCVLADITRKILTYEEAQRNAQPAPPDDPFLADETSPAAPPQLVSGLRRTTTTKFEITDEAALRSARPDLFSPDESKIRAALKITRQIPGLKVWEETHI